MRLCIPLVILSLLPFTAFAQPAPPAPPAWVPTLLTQEEATDGFYPLFTGTDLSGWWMRGANEEAFKAENGELVITGVPDGDWMFTDKQYENFVLRYEYKLPPTGGNSGVGIRALPEGDPAYTGMEIQVLTPGWETPWQRSGALYAVVPPAVQADKPVGEWNSVEVLCDGDRIRALMNGQELYDIRIPDYATPGTGADEWRHTLTERARVGHIGIQCHSDSLSFRNIRIKPLPGGEGWRPLFNGDDLTGWQPIGDAQWTAATGVLSLNGAAMTQRSALRTTEEFANFELRLSARPQAKANSGVFFRCSGDNPWPRTYEAQIDNNEPEMFTGSIWDQIAATELRALDGCWFQMKIIANGPHVTVDVNGKTVVTYDSPRHDAYPSGWISLQAHDPGTVCDFKDIEIKPLPAPEPAAPVVQPATETAPVTEPAPAEQSAK